MAVTITKPVGPYTEGVIGNRRFTTRNVQLDSTYVTGGYGSTQGFNAAALGLGGYTLKGMFIEAINGQASSAINAYIDYATSKLVITRAPGSIPAGIIAEETVTIATNAGRLANVPAYILAMEARAGGTTGAFTIVPTGSVLATTQVDVNFTNGNIKTFATDAVTSIRCCYIPMGVGPFIPSNMVIDESATLANGSTTNLANQAALVQYVYESTTLKIALPIIGTQNSPAAGQIQLNLVNSTNTTITDNAAQNTKVAKVTYWKKSAFAAGNFGYFTNASVNSTSSVINYVSAASGPFAGAGTFIPGYGVHHAALATNTDVPSVALAPDGTAATNSPVYDPIHNNITYVGSDSITREYFGGLTLNPLSLAPSNEALSGQNLSGITIRATFFAV